jgi:hypothetical protein
MNSIKGWQAHDFKEAVTLAFREAGNCDLSPESATLFASAIDTAKISTEAVRSITTFVHGRYGRGATWHGDHWLIPLPQPRYDAQPIPSLTFIVQVYLVAAVLIVTRDTSYRITLAGPTGKPARLILPISFIQSILDDDLDQFELTGRDGKHTSWNVPGLREQIWLPNDFSAGLFDVLRRTSVASWLLGFGAAGEAVLPQVVGSLLGLQSYGTTEALPVGEQPFRMEVIVNTLTQMFGSARAVEMSQRWAPHLKSTMTNDEVTHFILKEEGRRF